MSTNENRNDFLTMNIAVLTGISRSAGGLFYAVSALCRGLQHRSVQVSVCGPRQDFSKEDEAAWGTMPVTPYHTVGPMGQSFALRRALRNIKPQIVHQHGIWLDNQWATLQWQKRTKRPVVISPHGMLDPWALQNSAWKKKMVGILFANESLRRATCLHALCQSEAESIRAYGLKNPIAIIPNGVDLPILGEQRAGGRGRKTLLFLGRIHPKKGLNELIEAWGRGQGRRKEWQLLIAGWDDGNHLTGLKQCASRSGLMWSDVEPSSSLCPASSDLCFLGPKFGEEKAALFRKVDAFILPSFSEGLPMSVLEAWSYGLPVVMTDFCNLPEGIGIGAAIQVEPTVESITIGLQRLEAMSDADIQSMGQKGRMLVENRFTWSKIAQNMLAVYKWCLEGSEKPDCIF